MQAMYHAEEGYLAATCEWLILSIDMKVRRVGPMPKEVYDMMAAIKAAHAHLPLPAQLNRTISIHNRTKK